jgi:amino acid transporter
VLCVCCLLPLLYSLPTAFIAVELATMYPESTGGQCDYVRRVFGARIGAHNTYWVWITTVIDSALYPQFVAAALQTEFDLDPLLRQWLPLGIVVLMAGVNMAGIDWLLRFEVALGAITLIPCIVLLGVGVPRIQGAPLLETEGELRISTMISWALWLYGGFTNIGVLAGEALTPRRSYLFSIALLVPMKLLFRFTPFIVAFSVAERSEDCPDPCGTCIDGDACQFGEGYFQSL